MELHLELQPLLAITAGLLVLVFPKLLNYIIAIYLIAYGILNITSF